MSAVRVPWSDQLARSSQRIFADEGCAQHPEAGPGVLGVEVLEFTGGLLTVACLRCPACHEAYLTDEQALVAESEATRRRLF